jgi:putative flippase GtrA
MAKIIHKAIDLFRKEFARLFSFGMIGVTSLAATVGLYALFSRVLWVGGPHTIEYVIVVVIVTWLNYELNRHFTFGNVKRSPETMGRFAMVALASIALNAIIFWIGHEMLHLSDFIVIIATAFMVAAFTFTSHRLFTFHPEPWRFLKKKV